MQKNNATTFVILQALGEKNEIADVKYFEKAIKHKFENNEFFIPIGYDGYLSTVYGDYMTLPPLEKQCTHHESVAYWCEKEE